MHETIPIDKDLDKTTKYELLLKQLKALVSDENDLIANMANISALLFTSLEDVNWAGFYFMDSPTELVLGPFQGPIACTRIPRGVGVCGTAWAEKSTLVVANVDEFPGHIACDLRSNSEIVIPLIKDDRLIGVLDLDSSKLNRFSEEDKINLEKLVMILITNSNI